MTTFSKIQSEEIAALTKRIFSKWPYQKKCEETPLSNAAKMALKSVGVVNFDTWEELENWRKWENDDNQLEKRIANALRNI